jgi:hypothetical protein
MASAVARAYSGGSGGSAPVGFSLQFAVILGGHGPFGPPKSAYADTVLYGKPQYTIVYAVEYKLQSIVYYGILYQTMLHKSIYYGLHCSKNQFIYGTPFRTSYGASSPSTIISTSPNLPLIVIYTTLLNYTPVISPYPIYFTCLRTSEPAEN